MPLPSKDGRPGWIRTTGPSHIRRVLSPLSYGSTGEDEIGPPLRSGARTRTWNERLTAACFTFKLRQSAGAARRSRASARHSPFEKRFLAVARPSPGIVRLSTHGIGCTCSEFTMSKSASLERPNRPEDGIENCLLQKRPTSASTASCETNNRNQKPMRQDKKWEKFVFIQRLASFTLRNTLADPPSMFKKAEYY